ncbi:MAG: hypothetical protein GY796_02060 [Chloroflexi bacterium]|nr:hypothetical protein [Chloroflexota bacterium]
MTRARETPKWAWVVLAVIFVLLTAVIWLGPDEQTLGNGIKSVYVHVGLTWAGMAGLGVAAFLGLLLSITNNLLWDSWMKTVGWVGTAVYGAGIFMSMVASQVNWGGVLLQEPRMAAALNGLAIALIVQVLLAWLPPKRWLGLLPPLLFGLIIWLNGQAALVLHPPNPVRTTESSHIQLTFLAVFVLFSLVGVWLAWFWGRPTQESGY